MLPGAPVPGRSRKQKKFEDERAGKNFRIGWPDMKTCKLIDRVTMVVALGASICFFWIGEYEAAGAALSLWPLSRALISILDVFFLFFTERPLIRSDMPTADLREI